MKAFFLTAGLGTRFRPYSLKTPKPMLPFFGIPMFLFSYEFFKLANFDTALFNLHHLAEDMKKGVLTSAKDANLIFSLEENKILGSGGALLQAKEHLTDDFLLANGDEVFFAKEFDLNAAIKEHKQSNRLATLFCTEHLGAGTKFGALWLDSENNVLDIGKDKSSLKPKHYVGLAILSPEVLKDQEVRDCNVLYDLLYPHLHTKRITAKHIDMQWFETGNVDDYLLAHKYVAKHWQEFSNLPMFKQMLDTYLPAIKVDTKNGLCLYYDTCPDYSGFAFIDKDVRVKHIKDAIIIKPGSYKEIENTLIL